MAEETKVETIVAEQQQVKTSASLLDAKEFDKFISPMTSSFISDGTKLRIFPGVKEAPIEDEAKAQEVLARPLKITRSNEDVNMAYAHLKRLETLKKMIENAQDFNQLRKRTKETRDKIAQVFRENLTTIFAEQRNLEKTYREVDNFFFEAQLNPGEKVDYIHFVNAHPDKNFSEITDSDTGLATFMPSRENFDMKALVGLMVMPDWPGSEAKLKKYGEMAQHFAAHLFAGFEDISLSEALEKFDVGGEYAELKSQDRVKQHISVAANPLRIRRANQFEESLGDFYVSPTTLLAGKIYKGDIKEGIHIAQANKPHEIQIPTPDGSPLEMKWNIRGAQEMKFNKSLIPVAYYEGLVFWGVDTLYLASGQGDEGMDQYTVKRCDEYVSKVVLHFLNGRTFVPNETKARDDIRSAISKFLMNNTGGPEKMLEQGKVIAVESVKNPDGTINNQAVDIKVQVKYKNAIRNMNLFLVSDENHMWKEG